MMAVQYFLEGMDSGERKWNGIENILCIYIVDFFYVICIIMLSGLLCCPFFPICILLDKQQSKLVFW